MDRETQFLQTVLDFRTAHKQTPQKARTVILDHRGDRTLVYRQITTRIPILAFTESVVKTILTPDASMPSRIPPVYTDNCSKPLSA